jgi:chromosome segregation ATPase
MTTEKSKPSGFVRFLQVLLRLILIILIGILIGAGLYFGFKYVYNQVVTPIQQNQAEIQSLNTRVNQQWDLLNEKNIDLEERLTQIENDQDLLNNQVSEMLTKIDQNAADLEAFDLKFNDLVENTDNLERGIQDLAKQDEEFQNLNEEIQTSLENMDVDNKVKPLKQEVAIFKILLQINRSRLFLVQDNLGLAEQELLIADEMFESLSEISPENEEEIASWNARLNLAINHLPNNPVLANDDLEILWTMMSNGFTEADELTESESLDETDVEETVSATETNSSLTPTPTPEP